MNGSGKILLLLGAIGLVLMVTSQKGRDALDILLGRKRAC